MPDQVKKLNNIVAKKTTELVLLFHKRTTKLVFLWPNMCKKSFKVLSLNLSSLKEEMRHLFKSRTQTNLKI